MMTLWFAALVISIGNWERSYPYHIMFGGINLMMLPVTLACIAFQPAITITIMLANCAALWHLAHNNLSD
jgi:hypothetical protein